MLLGGPLAAPAGLAAATEVSPPTTPAPTEAPTEAPAPARTPPPDRPNIVLILMDDFSLELLATMPQAQRLMADGATYRERLRHRLAVLPVAAPRSSPARRRTRPAC